MIKYYQNIPVKNLLFQRKLSFSRWHWHVFISYSQYIYFANLSLYHEWYTFDVYRRILTIHCILIMTQRMKIANRALGIRWYEYFHRIFTKKKISLSRWLLIILVSRTYLSKVCYNPYSFLLQYNSKYCYIGNRRRILMKCLLHSKPMPYFLFLVKNKLFFSRVGIAEQ